MGYSEKELADVNHKAIDLLLDIRDEFETEASKMVISGCIGPREDAYLPDGAMTPDEAQKYHREQIKTLDHAGVDMICAMTLNEPDEAIGITRVAQSLGIPTVISFSLEAMAICSMADRLRMRSSASMQRPTMDQPTT